MSSFLLMLIGHRRIRQLGQLMLVVACLAVAGCCSWNLRGDGFPEDELTSMPKHFRPTDPDGEAFAFSNKARQIERNLGFR